VGRSPYGPGNAIEHHIAGHVTHQGGGILRPKHHAMVVQAQRVSLCQGEISVVPGAKADHVEAFGSAVNDLQRLGANRAGGAEDDHASAQGFSHC
jgi:hypothetical protein